MKLKKLTGSREFLLFIIVIAMFAIVSIINPAFFSFKAVTDMVKNNAVTMIMALGMLGVMLVGGIDISITSTLALSGMAIGMLLKYGHIQSTLLAFLITLCIGTACGFFIGLVISRASVPPIIATMGFMYIYRAMGYLISNGGEWAGAAALGTFKNFGTGTLLDTARLIRTLSEQTGVSRDRIEACVLGEHGDSSMIPFSAVRIDGKAPEDFPGFDAEAALARTHEIGMDIINGKGSTEFGIGQAAAYLIRNILENSGAVLPLSVELRGEYGLEGVHCGVPCAVGREGVMGISELPLTEAEAAALFRSAGVIERHIRLADDVVRGL